MGIINKKMNKRAKASAATTTKKMPLFFEKKDSAF